MYPMSGAMYDPLGGLGGQQAPFDPGMMAPAEQPMYDPSQAMGQGYGQPMQDPGAMPQQQQGGGFFQRLVQGALAGLQGIGPDAVSSLAGGMGAGMNYFQQQHEQEQKDMILQQQMQQRQELHDMNMALNLTQKMKIEQEMQLAPEHEKLLTKQAFGQELGVWAKLLENGQVELLGQVQDDGTDQTRIDFTNQFVAPDGKVSAVVSSDGDNLFAFKFKTDPSQAILPQGSTIQLNDGMGGKMEPVSTAGMTGLEVSRLLFKNVEDNKNYRQQIAAQENAAANQKEVILYGNENGRNGITPYQSAQLLLADIGKNIDTTNTNLRQAQNNLDNWDTANIRFANRPTTDAANDPQFQAYLKRRSEIQQQVETYQSQVSDLLRQRSETVRQSLNGAASGGQRIYLGNGTTGVVTGTNPATGKPIIDRSSIQPINSNPFGQSAPDPSSYFGLQY